MTTKRVAKRKLTNIDFSQEESHIALVSKEQGGPANGADFSLVLKANNYSEEFIQKVQKIQVTLELPIFLERFFGLYGSDAEVLARLFGYVPEEDDDVEYENYWENMIQERLDSFEILKSLDESESLPEALAKLTEDEYLSMIQTQETFEKAEKVSKKKVRKNSAKAKATQEEGSTKAATKVEELDDVTKSKVEPSETPDKGKQMEELAILQKALDENKEALTKALATLAVYETEKKEMVRKARFELLKNAVKDEAKAESLFKGLSLIEDEAEFSAVVKTLADMQSAIETSSLFTEQGAQVEGEVAQEESAVAKVIKQRLAKNK